MTVLDVLKSSRGAVLVDTLASRTGLSTGQVLGQLTLLEVNGQVRERGGRYEYIEPAKQPKTKAKQKARGKSSKVVRSDGKTVVMEQCGCRTLHRNSSTGRFVKGGARG